MHLIYEKMTSMPFICDILVILMDDEHYITMPEIIEALVAYDISTERKSLYISLILKLFGTMDSHNYYRASNVYEFQWVRS